MRWFRSHTEPPKLLSLSPLRVDEDTEGESLHCHSASPSRRDMSPVRWTQRKLSANSESERNCYNLDTCQVTTEKCNDEKKERKSAREEKRISCEKRNPLLDKVKNTRLSFFKDKIPDKELEKCDDDEFHSMCHLERRGLTRNQDLRRSVCDMDFKEITEEEKTHAKRKRRSKSQTKVSSRKSLNDQFTFVGFNTLKPSKSSQEQINNNKSPAEDGAKFNSVTSSSCLAVKFRVMQDRYFKSSTGRLIAKIYKRDVKDKEHRTRLRSFSYGTLPGLDELRTNPLFDDQDQDDNDSGILDNGSATSSLVDDRCSSGASGFVNLTTTINDTSLPPSLPPRNSFTSITKLDNDNSSPESQTSRISRKSIRNISKHHHSTVATARKINMDNEQYHNESIEQATNREIIEQCNNSNQHEANNNLTILDSQLCSTDCEYTNDVTKQSPPIIRCKNFTTQTIVVKLPRESADQSLGIFIAKTSESSAGYLVAHVVPNGLADEEGTLKIGDEILIVNGKRLRGLSMGEARNVVGSGNTPGEVDIVISRYIDAEKPKTMKNKLKESSVDYENVIVDSNTNGVLIQSVNSPKLHFKKNSKHYRDKRNESNRSVLSDNGNEICREPKNVSNFCTLPRRPHNSISTFHTVVFEKGPGKKSLGFTIVGGRDSPKGSIGIFIKSVLPGGQAAEDGRLRAGDEILAVNGQVSHDLTHREAVQLFRNIKNGPLALHLCRRIKQRDIQIPKAKSCADLLSETDQLDVPNL
ncbi:hypothetical protein PV326_012182 [Microctonus aethiopoides]|uniref:PDZ domain-containing protein n=1 Tax=Microctonus aethiopoides TaxID=144406 RepID=A0AA39FI67_9HYME|nr:hypothetical protein PV326_012182 [Microctonus aethiopoides]KAK0170047.1 hypothetical protein PV328_010658 [Microctonus aethiopoides]